MNQLRLALSQRCGTQEDASLTVGESKWSNFITCVHMFIRTSSHMCGGAQECEDYTGRPSGLLFKYCSPFGGTRVSAGWSLPGR